METLKYTVIKNETQYRNYCHRLEELTLAEEPGRDVADEAELLTVLIEKWDQEQNTLTDLDPVQLLQALLKDHGISASALANSLGVNKSLVSDILHYRRALSKIMIRKLAELFRVSQEAFNRPYPLRNSLQTSGKRMSAKRNAGKKT